MYRQGNRGRLIWIAVVVAMILIPAPSVAARPYRVVAMEGGGLRPWSEIHDEMQEIAELYPELTRLEEIGKSAEGRPLLALRVADDPDDLDRPCIMLVGAHHANEASTPEHVMDAVQLLLSSQYQEPFATWLQRMALVAVPMVNPDGSHAFWDIDQRLGRKNRSVVEPDQVSLGVDLNRNYPFQWDGPESRYASHRPNSNFFRGPAAASEPEVRAMIRLGYRERPVALVSYHSAAARLLVPYAVPGVEGPAPDTAWRVAQRIVENLPHPFPRGPIRASSGLYSVTGVEKDWYFHSFGTLAYVLELPFRRAQGERLIESLEHTRPVWTTLFERWLEGPSLSIRAIDEAGQPIAASVQIDQIETRAGEQWTTHPGHGWFHHYLPTPGVYTVRLATEAVEVVEEVAVWQGWQAIGIRVAPPSSWAMDEAR